MKVLLNKSEIEYLCKLLVIEANDLFCFESSPVQIKVSESEIEAGLISKNIIVKTGSIKVKEDIEKVFRLWADYKNSIAVITEDPFSLQAVTSEYYVLLFSRKEDDYVFEFEPAEPLVYFNAIKTVALLQDLNCEDSFVFILNLDEAKECLSDIEKNETSSIDKVSKSTGIASDELKNLFSLLSDEKAQSYSVITESKSAKVLGHIKIVKTSDYYLMLKIITGNEQNKAVIAKGSTNYVLKSIYNF